MTENMQVFLKYVSSNPEAFPAIKEMTKEEIIAAAKEKGFTLVPEDFAQPAAEINDDELDAAAGGGRCICSFGGGGKASEGEKTCACVMGGGEYTNGSVSCVCVIGGDGNW